MKPSKIMRTSLGLAAVLAVAACGGREGSADGTALQNDLALAAQQQPYMGLDSMSALEAGRADSLAAVGALGAATGSGALRSSSASGTRTTSATTARRTSSSGSRTSGTAGTRTTSTATAPASREVLVKNTKRDAAIGAAAGAIIGAAASKDKVKGGLIGAAVGGVLGGVIGNNVDVKKKKVPPER